MFTLDIDKFLDQLQLNLCPKIILSNVGQCCEMPVYSQTQKTAGVDLEIMARERQDPKACVQSDQEKGSHAALLAFLGIGP